MRKCFFLILAVLALAFTASAQNCFHSEVYAGYTATTNGKEFSRGDVRNGAQVSYGINATARLQFQAAVSINRGPGEQIALTLGPKYSFRPDSRIDPFLSAGAGLQRSSFPTSSAQARDAQFVWQAGGGIDVRAGRWSFRIVQAEYVSAKQTDGTQNRLRVGAGVGVRF